MTDLRKVIGICGLTNVCSVLIYAVDYTEGKVLASMNDASPEWCPMAEQEADGETEDGFLLGSLFIPWSGVMRFYGGLRCRKQRN